MNDELDERGVVDRAPPPWGAEITPLTEVCGGQYVLLHELARGDLSIVYRAKPAGSRDVIAFKVIQPRYMGDETQVRRFRREAELLKRIEHPNVVRLIDHGTIEDGRDFLALELLGGRTLAVALAKATRMSPERTCRIARQVARALRAMHKVGVIHRDLRPENILLIGPEDAERVKLVDLSDAGDVGAPARRVKDSTGKGASGPKGEATYRAPEQVRKRPPHPSMDVFALGVIMYEMLAGEHPFAKPKAPPGKGTKLGGHTIRTKAFDAPEVLLGLVADCIERDPDERPRTMDAVLDRIDKALLWMGVVPREVAGDEADEDRRTQLWAAADGNNGSGKPPPRPPAPPRAEAAPRAPAAPRAEAAARAPAAPASEAAEEELEFDLEDADTEDALPSDRTTTPSSSRTRKPWELANKPSEPEPREPPRRAAPDAARRAREDEDKARAQQEEARRAQEELRRAQEEARRAQEEARRAQEAARRAQEETRRERERGRRDAATGSVPRIDLDELKDRDHERGRREGPATGSMPRVDPDELKGERGRRDGSSTGSVPRIDLDELKERGRRDGPSTGSVPRIDLDELRERERASRDGPSSGSVPRIDLDDLAGGADEGAPTGPRFVVDTVAWTKQQPSAEPGKGRKRHVGPDAADDRGSGERERPTARSSSSQRLPREEAAAASQAAAAASQTAAASSSRSRPRPPTAVHQPVDVLPRWLLPLLVLVLVALAYAVYLVWTQ